MSKIKQLLIENNQEVNFIEMDDYQTVSKAADIAAHDSDMRTYFFHEMYKHLRGVEDDTA